MRRVLLLLVAGGAVAVLWPVVASHAAINRDAPRFYRCLADPGPPSASSDSCTSWPGLERAAARGNARALYWLARLAERRAEPPAAVARFARALAAHPGDPVLQIGHLYALDRARQAGAFVAAFERASLPPVRPARDLFAEARAQRVEAAFDPNHPGRSSDITVLNFLAAADDAEGRGDAREASRLLARVDAWAPGVAAGTAGVDALLRATDPRLAAVIASGAARRARENQLDAQSASIWLRALLWCCAGANVRDSAALLATAAGAGYAHAARAAADLARGDHDAALRELLQVSDATAARSWLISALLSAPDDTKADRALLDRAAHAVDAVAGGDLLLAHARARALEALGVDAAAARQHVVSLLEARGPDVRFTDGRRAGAQAVAFTAAGSAIADGFTEVLWFLDAVDGDCYEIPAGCVALTFARNGVANGGIEWAAAGELLPPGFSRVGYAAQRPLPQAVADPSSSSPSNLALAIPVSMRLTRHAAVSLDIPVSPGQRYLAAARVRSDHGAEVSIGVEFAGPKGAHPMVWIGGDTSGAWTPVAGVLLAPAGATTARVHVSAFNSTGADLRGGADDLLFIPTPFAR